MLVFKLYSDRVLGSSTLARLPVSKFGLLLHVVRSRGFPSTPISTGAERIISQWSLPNVETAPPASSFYGRVCSYNAVFLRQGVKVFTYCVLAHHKLHLVLAIDAHSYLRLSHNV